jgi:virginiamycin B lyase
MDHNHEHCAPNESGQSRYITEFALKWPGAEDDECNHAPADPFSCCPSFSGSTHEIVYDPRSDIFWVSGQAYDHLARVTRQGEASYHPMPKDSAPHGLAIDHDGNVWVTLENIGALARIAEDGSIAEQVDICLHITDAPAPFNPRPHGLGVGTDGALWFTGKLTNSVGKVDTNRNVTHIALPTIGATPIYAAASANGKMWFSELTGNKIACVDALGDVTELDIPTASSRPIAIVPSPDGQSMWFSQEAGGNVARIDQDGSICEFAVPLVSSSAILAGLAFDDSGNLWVQQYIAPPEMGGTGDDYIVRLDKALLKAKDGDLTEVDISFFKAPSQRTVMHRIIAGPDGEIWFTELGINQVGRLILE